MEHLLFISLVKKLSWMAISWQQFKKTFYVATSVLGSRIFLFLMKEYKHSKITESSLIQRDKSFLLSVRINTFENILITTLIIIMWKNAWKSFTLVYVCNRCWPMLNILLRCLYFCQNRSIYDYYNTPDHGNSDILKLGGNLWIRRDNWFYICSDLFT